MALDSGLGLGFLVGSLALLAFVLYMTRVRGPSLPHEAAAEGHGDGGSNGNGEREDAAVDPRAGQPTQTMDACEICGENPASRSVNDMAVCAECDEELL
jgi:hypothetical protein